MVELSPEQEQATVVTARALGRAVRLEGLLYAGLVALALALRLIRLDWLPLSEAESAVALPAWQSALGEAGSSVPPQPLLYHLLRVVFWLLGGGSDVTARLVPALAGVVAVGLCWRLRGLLGRPGALSLAAFLAACPLWVFYGRQVTSHSLSLAGLLLLLGALVANDRSSRVLVPLALALTLVAGELAYGFVLAVVLYLLVAAVRGELRDHWTVAAGLWPEPGLRQQALAVFLVTAVLAATGLLTRPDGFAALVQAPADWFARALRQPMGFWRWVVLPLLAYAPLTTLFGLLGLAMGVRRGRRFDVFVLVWFVAALVVALLLRSPDTVPHLLLPLTLAASGAVVALLEQVARSFQWHEDGVMVAILLTVLGFGLIQAFTHCQQGSATSERLLFGALLLAGALLVAYAFLWGGQLALRSAGCTALIALSLLGWSNGTALGYRGGRIVREPLHAQYVTSDAVKLAANLALASWNQTRDPGALDTLVDPSLQPVLGWRLRDRQAVTWGQPTADRAPVALITPGLGDRSSLAGGEYRGTRYAVVGRWQPRFGTLQNFLRWYLQRRPPAGSTQAGDIAYDQVELYLKTFGSEARDD